MREAFEVFDEEKQGFISAADFKFIMTNMGEKFSDTEIEDLMIEAGISNSG